ncbi:HAD-like domain-containing protein [Geranomyces variabilis]|nr:HAD-like domain-containing protein [Geranomyces variabilis]KAJ3133024.1 Pseudouridine-5'-phosphatase [Geranomyces variabilis]
MTEITHCIFDMDGLLLDTERIYTQVTQEILDKHVPGTKFTWELKSKLMGRTADESARMVLEGCNVPISLEQYQKEMAVLQEKRWPNADLMPGVENLIRHLKAHNIPIAVATSSTRPKFELKITRHRELFALFDSITCGDDPEVKNGKPAPDIFLVAKKRIGDPPASKCLVFEDAVNGIQAAKAAGMHCVWIPDVNMLKLHEGTDHGANEVMISMAEFDPAKYGMAAMKA